LKIIAEVQLAPKDFYIMKKRVQTLIKLTASALLITLSVCAFTVPTLSQTANLTRSVLIKQAQADVDKVLKESFYDDSAEMGLDNAKTLEQIAYEIKSGLRKIGLSPSRAKKYFLNSQLEERERDLLNQILERGLLN
jgi:hypothetical protein